MDKKVRESERVPAIHPEWGEKGRLKGLLRESEGVHVARECWRRERGKGGDDQTIHFRCDVALESSCCDFEWLENVTGNRGRRIEVRVLGMSSSMLVAQLCPTFVTTWTVTCWTLLSMGFSRQEHWSGLPFPHPGHLPRSPVLQADSLPSELLLVFFV